MMEQWLNTNIANQRYVFSMCKKSYYTKSFFWKVYEWFEIRLFFYAPYTTDALPAYGNLDIFI